MQLVGFLFCIFVASSSPLPWERLRIFLDIWEHNMQNFTVQIANSTHGVMFDWSSKNFTADDVVETDSSSKLVSGMAILDVMSEDAVDLSYDTHPQRYLSFWSNDSADLRSEITMHHLLSLTSGYTTFLSSPPQCNSEANEAWAQENDFAGDFVRALGAEVCASEKPAAECDTFTKCVQQTYERSQLKYVPGTIWDYCGFNLQVAGAVAAQASGRSINDILAHFLKKTGMTHSVFEGGAHVMLDGSLHASTNDYMTFLTKLNTGKILPPDVYDSIFELNTDFPVEVKTAYSWIFRSFLGRYSIANWYECPIDLQDNMRQECIDAEVHSCAGLSGFYPIIDHKLKYWMLVGHKGYPVIGCVNSVLLRLTIKPFIDEVIQGKEISMTLEERLEAAKQQLRHMGALATGLNQKN